MEQTEPISTLKQVSGKKYSFQKQTQFSKGNNVPYVLLLTHMVFFREIHVFIQFS
jgi:hypothetical protein